MKYFLRIIPIIFLFILCGVGMTDEAEAQKTGENKGDSKNENKQPSEKPIETSPPVITKHTLSIGGKTISYTATTGYMKINDEAGKHKANIFFTSYVKDGDKVESRPLTFAFNGGPGSASLWLHLGALGPKRVLMGDDGDMPSPPFRTIDNDFSWLEFSDLVFIDPVGTGFSRPAPEEKKEQFHGIKEDAASVGDFIRRYVTQNKRWTSPKFLAGESYGTTRAAALSGYLQDTYGMYLNGILLISSVLDFQTIRFSESNELPYILYLPSYTATAWYHKRLLPDLQSNLEKAVNEAREFAINDYLLALAKGDRLSDAEYNRIAEKLSRLTGLSKEYVVQSNLRINSERFDKELLRQERRTVGRFDSRFKGIDRDAAGEGPDYDPSYNNVVYGPFAAAVNDYLRSTLGYESDLPYEILTGKVYPWNWGSAGDGFPSVSSTLRDAMTKNPSLKVFVANGYYDLATPFLATEYTMDHLGLDHSLRSNISMEYYPAGHMMYIQKSSLEKLRNDAKKFVEAQ